MKIHEIPENQDNVLLLLYVTRWLSREMKYRTDIQAWSFKTVTGQLMMDFNRELNAENTVNVDQHDFTEIRSCQID